MLWQKKFCLPSNRAGLKSQIRKTLPLSEGELGQLARSKIERRGQDELTGIDDAVIARPAVGVYPEDLKATVLKDVADAELDVTTHLAIGELRAGASHQVGVGAGFVVDRFIRVVTAADAVGVGGGAEEADD